MPYEPDTDEEALQESSMQRSKALYEIRTAVHDFAKEIQRIGKKYPLAGIGDTSTDEDIIALVYEAIHWSRSWNKRR